MKLNKSLFVIALSSFIFTSSCACISENEQNQNIPEHVAEKLTRDKPPSTLLENINEAKKNQESANQNNVEVNIENLPHPPVPNNAPSVQQIERIEKPPEVTEKPKQSVAKSKKTTKKKESSENQAANSQEEVKPKPQQTSQEQQTQQTQQASQEESQSENRILPEVSSDEVEKFRNRIPTSENKDSKEYVIRGLVSMLLVIAGAILLVIVIITGVGNRRAKRARKRKNKNYFDDKL